MWNQRSHRRCSVPHSSRGNLQHLARCVDCRKPLFSQTWKERLKGQLRAKFPWPTKNRHEATVGRYTVKQRCSECQEPLRCSECSEAFFGNLSPEEIKVFIKAMVLYAMKGLCVDCNDAFKLVYHELFEDASCASSPASTADLESSNEKQYYSGSDESVDPNDSEIQSLNKFPTSDRKKGLGFGVKRWKSGVGSYDWKREINELLSNKFQLVLER
ncbi:unnamed protein product [Calypogeia fissa]